MLSPVERADVRNTARILRESAAWPTQSTGESLMRHLICLAACLPSLLTGLATTPTRADELVVGSFGGSFADNVKACHVAAFEKATGATVSLKLGNSSQFAAAIRATA